MARRLDHITHAVHDLDAAAAFYERLGFIVGARNRHSWGTHNRVIQLDRFYIELLTVGAPERIPPHAPRSFSFGAFHRDFLDRREGLDMLLLDSRDAAADAAAFAAAGIGDFDIFRFEREGRRPDGAAVHLAFSLVFATDPRAPDIGFVSCQHHHAPENFWNPDFQAHLNGATGVGGVVMVAENPSDHHIFLSAFTGERELLATSSGVTVTTPRGFIQVMEPAIYARQFGVPAPDIAGGARLAALVLNVGDVTAVAAMLENSKVAAQAMMGRIVVGPQAAMGAAIVFAPA
jgi:catechol 2,3-dioxygenase-like lactoylglutathione lyase family enzyme